MTDLRSLSQRLEKRQRTGDPLATLQILNPHPGIYAYYDGRTGERFFSQEPNWLDDGAFTLGVSTYAIVGGQQALVFDAHISVDHAAAMMRHLEGLGVTSMTVVYSHFHNDHIAGATAFTKNVTFVGHELTKSTLERQAMRLARGSPAITAVIPTQTYTNQTTMQIGNTTVELHHFNIHTPDGTALWLPDQQLLFVGDMLEDTATLIADASDLSTHVQELERMAELPIRKIMPAHGDKERIGAGGYDKSFIDATLRYLGKISEPVSEPVAWSQTLKQVVAEDLTAGNLMYFSVYDDVHRSNIANVREARKNAPSDTDKNPDANGEMFMVPGDGMQGNGRSSGNATIPQAGGNRTRNDNLMNGGGPNNTTFPIPVVENGTSPGYDPPYGGAPRNGTTSGDGLSSRKPGGGAMPGESSGLPGGGNRSGGMHNGTIPTTGIGSSQTSRAPSATSEARPTRITGIPATTISAQPEGTNSRPVVVSASTQLSFEMALFGWASTMLALMSWCNVL